MDKVIEIFRKELELLEVTYVDKLKKLALWQIDANLPVELKGKSFEEKTQFLLAKFRTSNPIYLLISEDLKNIKISNRKELNILNIDPRHLESKGIKEEQLESFYKFVELVKNQMI